SYRGVARRLDNNRPGNMLSCIKSASEGAPFGNLLIPAHYGWRHTEQRAVVHFQFIIECPPNSVPILHIDCMEHRSKHIGSLGRIDYCRPCKKVSVAWTAKSTCVGRS